MRIDPCLPGAWRGFSAEHAFRGRLFHIVVDNADQSGRGVAEFRLDGRRIGGSLVPGDLESERNSVEVRLGAS